MHGKTLAAALAAAVAGVATADVPVPVRTVETRRLARVAENGTVVGGAVTRVRTEHRDERGRLIRWEIRDGDGTLETTWVGLYGDADALAPDRAAYWSGDGLVPYPELFVTAPDGRMQDVLYGDPGTKPRRQLRQYLDAAGREIYQEYFAPRSQRRYSEEVYRYDDEGNELGRTWRRLDGRAARATRFELTEQNEHGHWTRRHVHVDGTLVAVDDRTLEYGTSRRPHPPASAGPVPRREAILPIPLAPGVISTQAAGENTLTFGPNGRSALFTRYQDDWRDQRGYFVEWREGAWREPEPVPFAASMYNAALAADGHRIIYCVNEDGLETPRVFVTERREEGWSRPIDLTGACGFSGSYFRLLGDGTLYFHRDGDLYRGVLGEDDVRDIRPLGPPVNTADGVEFGPWIDAAERTLVFTRAVEDAPERSGLFVSVRTEEGWTPPRRLPLPYGWSPVLTPDGEDLVYVVDDDVCRVPVVLLRDGLADLPHALDPSSPAARDD